MSWVWCLFLFGSIVCALYENNLSVLSTAALSGASSAVDITLSLAGPLCLWSGLSRLMEDMGWTEKLAGLLSPLLRKFYPTAWNNPSARQAICGNLSANLLGLGNAATPLGIRAAKEMSAGCGGIASDELCRLVVMNTASIQLIPTTVAALRASMGCETPFDILPAVWTTSVCSVTVGLLAARVLSLWVKP